MSTPPPHIDAETARRAWMARMLILVLGGPAAVFVPVFVLTGLPDVAGMMVGCLVPGVALLILLRDPRRVYVVSLAITMIVTVGILIGSWLTGGIASPALVWITTCPALAVLLVGRRRGGLVTLACVVVTFAYWTLDALGILAPTPYTHMAHRLHLVTSTSISVLAAFTLTVIFETSRIHAFREVARARDQAELASRAKADFLATMSHEIRTPITGVLGALELLDLSDPGTDRAALLRTARQSAEGLLTIINDILDFSKIEAGKLAIESVAFDLRTLAQDVAAALAPSAGAKGIALSTRVDPALPPALLGDPVRLRQVLFNLLGNAVKFTERGSVTLDAWGEVHADGGVALCLSVTDTGIGIPADRLEAIFESFSQVDGSTTRRYGGTGLGLAIVRRLVDLMGGTIRVSSVVGAGTTFQVTLLLAAPEPVALAPLPSVSEQRAAPVPPPAEAPRPGPVRVLVAEDNAVNQMIVRRMLERLGAQVEVVDTGVAAIAAARACPDIVFMDQHMPEMDGLDATRAIRAEEGSLRHTPIVALTASVLERDREACRAAGMDDFLSKPVTVRALQDALLRWTSWLPQHPGEPASHPA